jgi:hypothetical protein
MTKNTITIPADLVPQFEAWGQMTAQLFGQLNRSLAGGKNAHPIPEDQQWYWTKKWQGWEQEAEADIAAGRITGFDTMDELIADLGL